MIGIVYCIREISSDKIIYIGSTINYYKRKAVHKTDCYKHEKQLPLYQYIHSVCPDKNDFDNYFRFDELEIVDIQNRKELRQIEEKYIRKNTGILNQKKAFQTKDELKEYRRDYSREYSKTEKQKEYHRDYSRDYSRENSKTEKQKEYHRDYSCKYQKTEKRKEYKREYNRNYRKSKNNLNV